MRRRAAAALTIAALFAFAAVAAAADPTPVSKASLASCTTNSSGYCTVPHSLGGTVQGLAVTPAIPQGGQHYTLAVVAGTVTDTAVKVRAIKPGGSAHGSVTISFYVMASGVVDVPPPTTTVPPTTTTTTGAPTTTTEPPLPGERPNATNRGVPTGTTLTPRGGDDYTTVSDGEVITAAKMNALVVRHQNVVVRNSEITTAVMMDGGTLTIEDSTIGPATCGADSWLAAAIEGSGHYIAKRLHIRGHEDGFKAGGPSIEIRDSYIDLCTRADSHGDGVQDYPPANGLVFDHNTVEARGEDGINAGVFINSGDKPGDPVSHNVRLTNNLILGGGVYSFYLWPGTGTWEVHGNRVVKDTYTAPGPLQTSYTTIPYFTGGRCSEVDLWFDNDVVSANSGAQITATLENDKPC